MLVCSSRKTQLKKHVNFLKDSPGCLFFRRQPIRDDPFDSLVSITPHLLVAPHPFRSPLFSPPPRISALIAQIARTNLVPSHPNVLNRRTVESSVKARGTAGLVVGAPGPSTRRTAEQQQHQQQTVGIEGSVDTHRNHRRRPTNDE